MTIQSSLFDMSPYTESTAMPIPEPPLPPAQRHSRTSRAAAESMRTRAPSLMARVLAWFRERGPATDDAMIRDLQREYARAGRPVLDGTLRARRVKLVQDGFLRDSGRTALTASGREAVVWETTGISGD